MISLAHWIKKKRTIEQRDILDTIFWMSFLLLTVGGIIVYLICTPLVIVIICLLMIDGYLIVVNNNIAIKEIKSKTIKSNKTFK